MNRYRYDPVRNVWGGAGSDGEEDVRGPRNGERFPFYWRMDLSAERRFEVGTITVKPYLNLINIFNRKNVFLYTIDNEHEPAARERRVTAAVPAVVRAEDGMVNRRHASAGRHTHRSAVRRGTIAVGAGCELQGTTAPEIDARVVVHAAQSYQQRADIIAERTLRSVVRTTPNEPPPYEPIGNARVVIYGPREDSVVGPKPRVPA
jgi:hypothetical protein